MNTETMTATIKVWGFYDKDNRTPLLGEKIVNVVSYGEGRQIGKAYVKELGGHRGNIAYDGPNHNLNSCWI